MGMKKTRKREKKRAYPIEILYESPSFLTMRNFIGHTAHHERKFLITNKYL